MTPRPILKTHSSMEYFPSPSTALPFKFLHSPHVHFPPTPTLTDTQTTHSPFVYDRAPIVVSPNTCQLPERGGRVYHAFSMNQPPQIVAHPKGSYFHPRAFEVCEPEHFDEFPTPPPLIPDLSSSSSSESEDSDACASSPVYSPIHDLSISRTTQQDTPYHPSYSLTATCLQDEALAFLPHPHSQMERPRLKRRRTSRSRPPALDVKESCTEVDNHLSLDGCLGGF